MIRRKSADPLDWEGSARTDLRYWLLLLVGAVFVYAGFTIEPSTNCNDSGECAPWLVPVAAVMGLGASAIALGTLRANPQRGFKVDPATGELVWWQHRTRTSPGDAGQIAPAEIARIRVVPDSETDDLHVYDQAGNRVPYLDGEVIRDLAIVWAEKMVARWPHIVLEER